MPPYVYSSALEIPRQPTEASPFLTPDPEQSITLMQRTPSTSTAESGIDPPASAVAPDDSPSFFTKLWKRRWVRRFMLVCLSVGLVYGFIIIVAIFPDSGGHYADDQLSPDGNGVSFRVQLVKVAQLNDIPQVAILGKVTRFDWLDTQQLSMTWSIFGLGEYELQDSNYYVPPNRAVNVYLDEWVEIWLLYLGVTQRRNFSASTPAFLYDPTHLPMTGTGERLL